MCNWLAVHASPNFFSCFIFWIFFRFTFCRVLLFAECFLALGKDVFAEYPLPSVTLGKAFAECNRSFAECPLIPVVIQTSLLCVSILLLVWHDFTVNPG
jgi:hypothetical protein